MFSNARPRKGLAHKMMNSSVNAPLHKMMTKKNVKDISFKTNNMSLNTDNSERLRENMSLFRKN